MKIKYQLLLVLMIFSEISVGQNKTDNKETQGLVSFLESLHNFSSLPEYSNRTYSAEVSTYDRTGMNNDGFGGVYSFIRRNADSTLVLFDEKGPGVITRIWTPTPTDDTLDFYIDNNQSPSFSLCYRDLFSGKVFPFISPLCANQLGGYYAYLPIPFNSSCKIVLKGKFTRFHQIGYNLFPKETKLKSFSMQLSDEEKQELKKIQNLWSKGDLTVKDIYGSHPAADEIKKIVTIKPGSSVTLFQSTQPGRIAGFELISSTSLDSIARNLDIKITWDGEKVPAVYCPLAEYFGYAFGSASMKGLMLGSDGKRHYSWFPMPYDKSAKVELIYRNSSGIELRDITILSKFYVQNKKRDPVNEGKFYANWKRENPVPMGKPFTMLDIKGKGHFVGTVLLSQGLTSGMTIFFEGDDSTVVDGELRMHGTGSEDFFNGGWYALLDCWDDAMSLPLSGALDYSVAFSRTGGYRFFLGDKIPFEKSFFHSIEHGPDHNLVPSDYISVSYYYCDRNNSQTQVPSAENTKFYMQDTLILYPQLLDIATEGKVGVETKWAFPTGGLTFYYTVEADTKLRVSLRDIPDGSYHMYLDYVKNPEGTIFSIWQRQTAITEWMDTRKQGIERIQMQFMTDVNITPLNNTISFRFKPDGNKNQFLLNRIVLVKK